MRDNTNQVLDRGAKGFDRRVVSVESASRIVAGIGGEQGIPTAPGRRVAHTAAVYLKGTFEPSDWAADNLRSSVFVNGQIPTIARFSPTLMRNENVKRDIHGLALRLYPPHPYAAGSYELTDFVAIDTEPFLFSKPDAFGDFVRHIRGGIRKAVWAGLGFLGEWAVGTASMPALWTTLMRFRGSDSSLTGARYAGIHTFFYDENEDAGRKRIPFRYFVRFKEPTELPHRSGNHAIQGRYLDLADHVAAGNAVELELVAIRTVNESRLHPWHEVPGSIRHRLLDATRKWKHDWTHEDEIFGTLTLNVMANDASMRDLESPPSPATKELDSMVFDPTRLADGIFPSDDPILRARGTIYAESHWRSV